MEVVGVDQVFHNIYVKDENFIEQKNLIITKDNHELDNNAVGKTFLVGKRI